MNFSRIAQPKGCVLSPSSIILLCTGEDKHKFIYDFNSMPSLWAMHYNSGRLANTFVVC